MLDKVQVLQKIDRLYQVVVKNHLGKKELVMLDREQAGRLLNRGGGSIFGPTPKYYFKKVNIKTKQLALNVFFQIKLKMMLSK
jgi:hypothetical protein